MRPTIGRVVWYRSRTGAYTVPAMITCTTETLYEPAVEAGIIPALSSPTHVHLTVLSPGVPEQGPNAALMERGEAGPQSLPPGALSWNLAGTYQEWDCPFFDPMVHPEGKPEVAVRVPVSCRPVSEENRLEQLAGSWTWPERV